MTVVFIIDGARTKTLDDFYAVVGEAVNGPDGYFGRNLDAFGDCLTGGFGTPDDEDFRFVWEDAATARVLLGYEETARQLRGLLARCHPSNRERFATDLAEAEAGRGQTVFDWILQVFAERGRSVELS